MMSPKEDASMSQEIVLETIPSLNSAQVSNSDHLLNLDTTNNQYDNKKLLTTYLLF